MARILAVDWDQHEARYLVAYTSGAKVSVRVADCVPLVDVSEGGSEPRPDLAGSLASAFAEQGVGRATALVGVERSSIEVLQLTVPPAKDSELPDLVANQAMRESQLITDESVIDFVPASDDPSRPRAVTAAAIARQEIDRIASICATAGFKPARLLLRPYAAASFFLQTASPSEEVYLLVNRMRDEVDLSIVVEGRLTFSRTVRLPDAADPSRLIDRVLVEINRTLAAAPRQVAGDSIEGIYVFGSPDEQAELIERIRNELFLPAASFDPFEALDVPGELVPENPGRFAALLGMVLDEVKGRHALDFLHPRKSPKPPNRARLAAVAAGVLAVAVFGVAFNVWGTLSEIDKKNQKLAEREKQLDDVLKKAGQRQRLIDAVGRWKSRDVCWLDEIRDLSIRFPSARDAVVLRMSLTPSQSGGGVIGVQGLVRAPGVVYSMESRLRDGYRRVRSPRTQERVVETGYAWVFETTMSVARRRPEAYVSHLPQGPPSAPQTPAPGEKPEALAAAGTREAANRAQGTSP